MVSNKEICEPKYDVNNFSEGFARVKKGDDFGKLYADGWEEF